MGPDQLPKPMDLGTESRLLLDRAVAYLRDRAMWDDFDPVKVEREIFNAGEAYFLHRGTTTKEAQAALKKLIESIEAVIPLFKKNSPMARVLMPSRIFLARIALHCELRGFPYAFPWAL